jgi:hypothetical protein
MIFKKTAAAIMFMAVLFPVVFSGSQSLASSPLVKLYNGGLPQTHNPQSYTAFGQHVRVESTLKGLQLNLWGFKNNAEFDHLGFTAEASWAPAISITKIFSWEGTHDTILVKLTRPDDYQGTLGFFNPQGGVGTSFNFLMVVPQYGSSNLEFTTTSMPPAHIGHHYSFRFLVKGGTPPYTFYLLYHDVKGLVLTQTGRNAGLFSGVPVRQTVGYQTVPLIVWDKMHHAAFVSYVFQLS